MRMTLYGPLFCPSSAGAEFQLPETSFNTFNLQSTIEIKHEYQLPTNISSTEHDCQDSCMDMHASIHCVINATREILPFDGNARGAPDYQRTTVIALGDTCCARRYRFPAALLLLLLPPPRSLPRYSNTYKGHHANASENASNR